MQRWRYGETNPIAMRVKPDTIIEMGDLVWGIHSYAHPAIDASGALPFVQHFAGVAMHSSRMGESDEIRVATSGVFEFDCNLITWDVGTLIRPAESNDFGRLHNQMVRPSFEKSITIGKCARYRVERFSRVLVDIHSQLMGK